METIRVVIADDQHLVRGALAALLALESDIEVVADVATGNEALDIARRKEVDVLLLDIEMGEESLTGLEVAEKVSQLNLPARVLIVTTFGRPGYLQRALDAGALGFIVKDTPSSQLAEAVRRVHRGLRVIDPALAEESLFTPRSVLSEREADVLRATLPGGSIRHISEELGLSQGTVRNHISSAMAKVGADNRYEASRIARDCGWL